MCEQRQQSHWQPCLPGYLQAVSLAAESWLLATRLACTNYRLLLGLHRTPLLRQQVERLKLNEHAPLQPPKRAGANLIYLRG